VLSGHTLQRHRKLPALETPELPFDAYDIRNAGCQLCLSTQDERYTEEACDTLQVVR
jgi:hypothetical protein